MAISHMQHLPVFISKEPSMSNTNIRRPVLSEVVVEALTVVTVAISGFLALLVFSAA